MEIRNGMLPKFCKIVFVFANHQTTTPEFLAQFQQFFGENELFF
jgi:hypothetical protein